MDDSKLQCVRCEAWLLTSHFARRKSKRGYNSWCKSCQRAYTKEHYGKDRDAYKARAKQWARDNSEKRKDIARKSAKSSARASKIQAVQYKGGVCFDCKLEYPPCVYDFHHRDPSSKLFGLAQYLQSCGFEYCKEELDKCDMLCCNCHRIRHSHGK